MTSANVTYYGVYRDGKLLKEYHQNCLCKFTARDRVLKDHPLPDGLTLQTRWPDENEVNHYSVMMPLADWMAGKKLTGVEND